MTNLREKIIFILLATLLGMSILLIHLSRPAEKPNVTIGDAFTGNQDTWTGGQTISTSTINTTSTQVVSSTAKLTTLLNNSTSTFTCKPEPVFGTTAPSSTVVANAGYIIAAKATSTGYKPYLSVGECQPGMDHCYPFKGTLNCLADVQASITKIAK